MIQRIALSLLVGVLVVLLSACSDPTAAPTPTPRNSGNSVVEGLRYDPNGPDRDCPDFRTWTEAQAFFVAAGGPGRDPHRLDRDRDGIPCEALR